MDELLLWHVCWCEQSIRWMHSIQLVMVYVESQHLMGLGESQAPCS